MPADINPRPTVKAPINPTDLPIPQGYKFHKLLGKGAYGCVFSCTADATQPIKPSSSTLTSTKLAIKQLPNYDSTLHDAKLCLRELNLLKFLKNFNHPNIIKLFDVQLCKEKSLSLVLEYMETDLHKIIQSKQKLTTHHIRHFLFQLIRGTNFLHSRLIAHRDIKPANLLINSNCLLKIADFGLARAISTKSSSEDFTTFSWGKVKIKRHSFPYKKEKVLPLTEHVVTRWYRAPELMLQGDGKYNPKKIDTWSIGCVFGEMLLRKAIFPGKDFKEQLKLIFQVTGVPKISQCGYVTNSKAKIFLEDLRGKESWNGDFKSWLKRRKSSRSELLGLGDEEAQLFEWFFEFDVLKRVDLRNIIRNEKCKYFSKSIYQKKGENFNDDQEFKQSKEMLDLFHLEKMLDFRGLKEESLDGRRKFTLLKSELVNTVRRMSRSNEKETKIADTSDTESLGSSCGSLTHGFGNLGVEEKRKEVCYVQQGMKKGGLRWSNFGLEGKKRRSGI
eukprot:snap_masked-scaffold_14-processed-gene-5.41-mRNA-1 protein AED:0.20 eAED:0.20 QI:0/-1/0/1/-1/1/1/0/501